MSKMLTPLKPVSIRHMGAAILLGLSTVALSCVPVYAAGSGHSTHASTTVPGKDSSQDDPRTAHADGAYSDANAFDLTTATATLGTLHAYLSADVSKDGDSGTMMALASFTDTLFVTSGDPSVTSATLIITPRLDGTITEPAINALKYPVYNSYADFNIACDSSGTDIFDSRNNAGMNHSYNGGPFSLIVPVNTGIFLSASLYLQGSISGGGDVGGKLTEDFGDTAHVFVASSTPGVVVTSESGAVYAAPVPEASAFVSLGLGLLILTGLAWNACRVTHAKVPNTFPQLMREDG